MKKTLSVVLAALMLISVFGITAIASETIEGPHSTNSYYERDNTHWEDEATQTKYLVRGWFGFTSEVVACGYCINDGEPIFDDTMTFWFDDFLIDHAYSDFCYRFDFSVDTSEFKQGIYRIDVLVKIEGSDEVYTALMDKDGHYTIDFTKIVKPASQQTETTAPETVAEPHETQLTETAAAITTGAEETPKEGMPVAALIAIIVAACAVVVIIAVLVGRKKK